MNKTWLSNKITDCSKLHSELQWVELLIENPSSSKHRGRQIVHSKTARQESRQSLVSASFDLSPNVYT